VPLAHLAADGQAVQPGQHDVEHDGVVGIRLEPVERILPAVHDVDGMALLAQCGLEERRQSGLILDHQDAHGRLLRRVARLVANPLHPIRRP
jgi:hypothetical protein